MTDVRVLRVTQGFNGWSPRLAVVADGARSVLKLVGWTGGQGNPPPSGLYLGAIGYVTDIEDAVDINGDVDLSSYLTIANSRYQFVSGTGTTYTVPASAVTANGNTIIELSNNSLTSIKINAATSTGKTAGDSVTIQITGTYAAQLLVANGTTLNGTLAFSANAKIKTLIYRGSNVWTVLGG